MATSSSSTPNALRHTHSVDVFLGDDVATFGFVLRDDATTVMDKTEYDLVAQVKANPADTEPLAEWSLAVSDFADSDEVSPDTIRVLFSLTASVVSALGVGQYAWDLQVDGPTGTWTPIRGTLNVTQDVTHT